MVLLFRLGHRQATTGCEDPLAKASRSSEDTAES
jgi:hypothetical protein